MPMEKKIKTPEEKEFNKRWGKINKKNPFLKDLKKNVGKAPACNSKK